MYCILFYIKYVIFLRHFYTVCLFPFFFFSLFKANLLSNYSVKSNSYKTMQVICTEHIQMLKNPENSFSQSIFTQGFRFPAMQSNLVHYNLKSTQVL